jgi:hypothetical protein
MDLEHISLGARVVHPAFGVGVVFAEDQRTLHIFFKDHGEQTIARSFEGLKLLAPGPVMEGPEARLDMDSVKQGLEEVLHEVMGPQRPIALARKWEKGTLIMKPGTAGLQTKEVPIDTFFHKITMVRDRLRVMEQKINAHTVLTEADKADLQQYITRCYGSFTSFNVLFDDKDDEFVGQKGDG